MKIFRIIGNEGRITIPFAIRQAVGFLPDDVVCITCSREGLRYVQFFGTFLKC